MDADHSRPQRRQVESRACPGKGRHLHVVWAGPSRGPFKAILDTPISRTGVVGQQRAVVSGWDSVQPPAAAAAPDGSIHALISGQKVPSTTDPNSGLNEAVGPAAGGSARMRSASPDHRPFERRRRCRGACERSARQRLALRGLAALPDRRRSFDAAAKRHATGAGREPRHRGGPGKRRGGHRLPERRERHRLLPSRRPEPGGAAGDARGEDGCALDCRAHTRRRRLQRVCARWDEGAAPSLRWQGEVGAGAQGRPRADGRRRRRSRRQAVGLLRQRADDVCHPHEQGGWGFRARAGAEVAIRHRAVLPARG